MPIKFRESDLPLIYTVADGSSVNAQNSFLFATRVRLGSLIGSAFFGLFTWRFGLAPTDWAGVAAAICFLAALFVEVYLLTYKPERTWYEARAAAESVKTLTWRYMMGAPPFDRTTPTPDTDRLFLQQLDEVLAVVKDLDLVVTGGSRDQITASMQDTRSAPLPERKRIYEEDRVRDQQEWYSRKARWNREQATRWTIAMLAIEALGVIAAILKATGTIEGDLLGFAGALVAAMTAWLQTKQFRTLATAYTVTAVELASVRARIAHQSSDADWGQFVSDAEEAFSREHTLWKASRGIKSL